MKTKEIEVWVKENHYIEGRNQPEIHLSDPQHFTQKYVKATLIIEEPEPEITITPSRLREALRYADGRSDTYEEYNKLIEQELFGDSNE